MRTLLLLRHGNADNKLTGQKDRDRPLSALGGREAAWAGTIMRQAGVSPDMILVSAARRTVETAQALVPWTTEPEIHVLESLYLASAEVIAQTVRALGQSANIVLVVGHNPGLQDLASQLAGPAKSLIAAHFPTASLARFAVQQDWPTVAAPRGVTLSDFMSPPDLSGPKPI